MRLHRFCLLLISSAALILPAASGAPASIKTISLGTQPPFVQPVAGVVAPAKSRLYVFNGPSGGAGLASPGIAIVDTTSNSLIGRLQPAALSGMSLVDGVTLRNSAFLNPATNKVYAAYSSASAGLVLVIDATTDTIAQTLPIPGGISNIAFNPSANKLYVAQLTQANPTQLLVFDINTLAQVGAIAGVDNGAAGTPIAVNPANNKIYTAAAGSGLLVIDGVHDSVRAAVPLPAEIGEIAVDPVNNSVYAGVLPQTLWVIDGTTDQLSATVAGRSVFGRFSIDPLRNIVYSFLGNGFQIDGATNTLQTGPVFGNFAPPVNGNCAIMSGNAVDFTLHNWYSGCDGNLLIADTVTGSYKNTVPVSYVTFPGNGVVDPSSHVVYMINTQNNSVAALDPIALKATLIPLGNLPISIAADPLANRVYVADGPSSAAVVIDGATNNVISRVFAETLHPSSSPSPAVGVAASPGNNRYVFMDQRTAVVFDGTTDAVVATYSPGFTGKGIPNPSGFRFAAVNAVTGEMYTADSESLYISDLTSSTFSPFSAVSCPVGGLAVNAANNTVLVSEACQNGGRLQIYDGFTAALLNSVDLSAAIPASSTAGSIFFNPKTNKLYIASQGVFSTVEVFNSVSFAHLATIANVGGTLAANTLLNAIYGTFSGAGGGVAVIDGNTDTLSSTFGPGIAVSGLAVNEATNMIYVGDSSQGTVDVFLGDAPSPGAFTISGQVLSGSGAGVAGVTIASKAGTAVTDAAGLYTLFGVTAGTYTVSPTSAGFFFGPASQTVTVTGNSVLGVNFNALSTPLQVTGLTIAPPTSVGAGVATTATVTLNQPAPAGGIVLSLAASNKAAKVASSVTVPAGSSSANFTVQGNGVSSTTVSAVTASYSGSLASQASSASANLTVEPTDTLHIKSATWSQSTQLLAVTATSTSSDAALTLFLASNNQNLGTLVNQGGGNYSLQVPFTTGTPASVNLKSSLGGSTGQGVKVVP